MTTFNSVVTLSVAIAATVYATCSQPPHVPDTSTNATGTLFPDGTIILYSCNEGYTSVGASRYWSCNGSSWINGNISCDPITCPNIPTPKNGRIANKPTNKAGTVVLFKCDEGYDMTGEERLLCDEKGRWSPDSAPVCIPKDCGEFPKIPNAVTVLQGTLYGSTANVTCNNGFVLTGLTEVKCNPYGQWGMAPKCEPWRCPPYPKSSCTHHAQINPPNYYTIICKDDDMSATRYGPDHAQCVGKDWDNLTMACNCNCFADVGVDFVLSQNLNDRGFLKHNHSLKWDCMNGKTKRQSIEINCLDGLIDVVVNGTLTSRINSERKGEVNASVLQLCEDAENISAVILGDVFFLFFAFILTALSF